MVGALAPNRAPTPNWSVILRRHRRHRRSPAPPLQHPILPGVKRLTVGFILTTLCLGSAVFAASSYETGQNLRVIQDCPSKPDWHDLRVQKMCIDHGAVGYDGQADQSTCSALVDYWWHDRATRIDLIFNRPEHCP